MVCTKCNLDLDKSKFNKSACMCKSCEKEYRLARKRTKLGLISSIYSEQKQSSKARGHNLPEYSKDDLVVFILRSGKFETYYNNWVNSGYKKELRPSIDRIDNKIPYKLSNIQLVLWKDNNSRSHIDASNGEFSELSPVDKFDLKGNLLESYKSISEAARVNNISTNTIFYGCNHKEYAAKEYMWKYSKDSHIPKYKANNRVYKQYIPNTDILIFESSDMNEVRKRLDRKDLSPLNKSIRNNTNYLGYKWEAVSNG